MINKKKNVTLILMLVILMSFVFSGVKIFAAEEITSKITSLKLETETVTAPFDSVTISVKKLQFVNEEIPEDYNDARQIGQLYDSDKYGPVEFTLYKVDREKIKEHVEGLNENDINVKNLALTISKNMETYKAEEITTKALNEESFAVFENIPNVESTYLVLETKSPKSVVGKAEPMLIDLPRSGNKTHIPLVAKNQIKPISIDFNKFYLGLLDDKEKPLPGAVFDLYKETSDKGELIESGFITDEKGKIYLSDIPVGDFYLVERGVKGLVDDMIGDDDTGNLVVSKFARNDKDNILKFSVSEDGELTMNKSLEKFINYEKPQIDKKVIDKKEEYSEGDKVKYQINILVPQNILEYDSFYLVDIASENIDIIKDSIKVINDVDYKIESLGDNSYKLVFEVNEKLKDLSEIKVAYEASISKHVDKDSENTVELFFSNGKKIRTDKDSEKITTVKKSEQITQDSNEEVKTDDESKIKKSIVVPLALLVSGGIIALVVVKVKNKNKDN